MATPEGCGEEMTVFEILSRCGRILLGDEDMGLVFVWNGSLTFTTFQHAGRGKFYAVDAWTVEGVPATLDVATRKCRERLSDIVADEEINEHHDLLVAKAREAVPKRAANFRD